jgi:hypothetical protein
MKDPRFASRLDFDEEISRAETIGIFYVLLGNDWRRREVDGAFDIYSKGLVLEPTTNSQFKRISTFSYYDEILRESPGDGQLDTWRGVESTILTII